VGQGRLIAEVSRLHSDIHTTPVRTSLDERSARRRELWQQTTLTTDINTLGGIRIRNTRKRTAADQRLRPRGHRDRLFGRFRIL